MKSASPTQERGPAVKPNTSDRAKPWRISMFPLLALLAGALVLGGCGSSKSTSTAESTPATTAQSTATTTASTGANSTAAPTATTALSLEANPQGQLKYNTSSLTAKAGKVTIDFGDLIADLDHGRVARLIGLRFLLIIALQRAAFGTQCFNNGIGQQLGKIDRIRRLQLL